MTSVRTVAATALVAALGSAAAVGFANGQSAPLATGSITTGTTAPPPTIPPSPGPDLTTLTLRVDALTQRVRRLEVQMHHKLKR